MSIFFTKNNIIKGANMILEVNFNATKLRQEREAAGLNQTDFILEIYKRLGFKIARPTLGSWESGRAQPGLKALVIIAEFFNKPIEYFIEKRMRDEAQIGRPGKNRKSLA